MMIKNSLHTPVLLNESINLLNVNPNGVYVDCTAGRGGHSSAILNKLSTNGRLVCVDVDDEAITYLTNLFKQYKCITVVKGNFKDLPKILESININMIDGIIADLGVSSPMFDNPERGFSYHHDSVLDMRMDQNQEIDAKYVINNYSFKQLNDIFREYGDIINPTKVVNNIIKTRSHHEITTTKELVDIIKSSLSWKELLKEKHPAKVYFQALRIEVNNELENLTYFLENVIPNILNKNGRAVIITFHSSEDKIVKNIFAKLSSVDTPKEVPIIKIPSFNLLTKKPITCTESELVMNNRSRSAKLRGVVKNV